MDIIEEVKDTLVPKGKKAKGLKKYIPFIAIGGVVGLIAYLSRGKQGKGEDSFSLPDDSYGFIGDESVPEKRDITENFVDYTDKFISINEKISGLQNENDLLIDRLDNLQDNTTEIVTMSSEPLVQDLYKERTFIPQVVDEVLSSQIDKLESSGYKVDDVSSAGVTRVLVNNNIPPEIFGTKAGDRLKKESASKPQTTVQKENTKIAKSLESKGVKLAGTNSRIVNAALKREGLKRSDF